MMGQRCQCNHCDFQFMAGHSHHAGASFAICLHCLTEFSLPTESPWGPAVGELIQLFQVHREWKVRHKKKPPVCQFRFEPTNEYLLAEPSGAGWFNVIYPIDTLTCPSCQQLHTLVLDFDDGASCPKCKQGTLQCHEVIY